MGWAWERGVGSGVWVWEMLGLWWLERDLVEGGDERELEETGAVAGRFDFLLLGLGLGGGGDGRKKERRGVRFCDYGAE